MLNSCCFLARKRKCIHQNLKYEKANQTKRKYSQLHISGKGLASKICSSSKINKKKIQFLKMSKRFQRTPHERYIND